MSDSEKNVACDSSCSCRRTFSRRDFVEILGFGAAAALTAGLPVMAGPFEIADFDKIAPADKKLDPRWVASLFERGSKTVYRGPDLEKIGMPIGGLCAGQIYVGGDGRLWHWDIFNENFATGDAHYAQPLRQDRSLAQGFALFYSGQSNGGWSRAVQLQMPKPSSTNPSRRRFSDISFSGEYPLAKIEYKDADEPLTISMELFSPFIPLNTDDSSLPATVIQLIIKNVGEEAIHADLLGYLENAVCCKTPIPGGVLRENRAIRDSHSTMIECGAAKATGDIRPEIVVEDFDKETYEGWKVEGTAFGTGPISKANIPGYQGDVGGPSRRVVNSHATAPGGTIEEKDQHIGKLTGRPFVIERNYLSFWIGGGNHPEKTCLNLVIDGKIVRTETGHNDNRMRSEAFDVRRWQGKTAVIEIVDQETGPWGNIGIAHLVQTDQPIANLAEYPDYGTLAIALLDPQPKDAADCDMDILLSSDDERLAAIPHETPRKPNKASVELNREKKPHNLLGSLKRSMDLKPGEEKTATYVIAWHFPNLNLKDGGRYYANRFASASDVAGYIAKNFTRLAEQTRLWRDTWYDSTLPYWFLDRTFANTSTLATSTCHRFKSGRFYGWEGVGCCEGTCTHVWHYAQAVARLFPDLERDLRRRVDFGSAQDPSGMINHRGEGHGLAVDGQAGCILRAYREHQMSADGKMLAELWPKIKLAMRCLIQLDRGEGILEGPQHNTLDTPWFGKVAWLSSLYMAAARACEEMAKETGDEAFSTECRAIVERSRRSIDTQLFNGEYYIQIPDKENTRTIGSYDGCEIDQVFGQSWAFQLGLGRILDEDHVKKSLASLWKNNFTPDVGPFRKKYPAGRWYAMPGEGGLLMCSWPQGDKARVQQGFDAYFNECMTGFEYQVAGHMIWEGMLQEGLAVVRAIHDRYHASRRNPWNEVECGDHYARAMASYGVFLAACGYEYHGPHGYLAFSPRLSPDNFRAAFTTAEGWGTFAQKRDAHAQSESILVRWGRLRVRTLAFEVANDAKISKVVVSLGGKAIESTFTQSGRTLRIVLTSAAIAEAGQKIDVRME
jgi:uncharacterized protein (DUF608 family)